MFPDETPVPEHAKADMVFSYTVGVDGVTDGSKGEYQRMQRLLADGYRVLDVFSTAAAAGAAELPGFVCVTVVVSNASRYENPYLLTHRQAE